MSGESNVVGNAPLSDASPPIVLRMCPNPDLVSAGKGRAGFKMRHLHYCDRYKGISTPEGISRGNPSPTT